MRARASITAISVLLLVASPVVGTAHAGVGVWTGNGPRGGTVLSLAFDPTNPSTLYAGTGSGGVYRSRNGGSSWSLIGLGGTTVPGIAVDPTDPSTLYAAVLGQGVFKSENGGRTWSLSGLAGGVVEAVAVDPSGSGTVYAGDEVGIYRSADGGGTWALVSATPHVATLAFDPSDPLTAYAGSSPSYDTHQPGTVVKTTDGGTTWAPADVGLPTGERRLLFLGALAVSPSAPQTLYAGTNWGMYASVDGADSWAAINDKVLPSTTFVQGVAIDPFDPARVWAAGGGALYRSLDGHHWTRMQFVPSNPTAEAVAVDPVTPDTVTTGLFKTTDGGATWSLQDRGLTNSYVLSVAMNPQTPTELLASAGSPLTGSYYVVFRSHDAGAHWSQVAGVPDPCVSPNVVRFDPRDPSIGWLGAGGACRSLDSGATWSPTGLTALMADFVRSFGFDPTDPNTLFAGTVASIPYHPIMWKTTDGGTTWSNVDAGLPNDQVNAIQVDPSDPLHVVAALNDVGVYATIDGGATWSPSASGLPSETSGDALAMDPSDPSVLYVGTDRYLVGGGGNPKPGGVYRSADGGASWTRMSRGIPASSGSSQLEVLSVAVDPTDPNVLYAGTNLGVFRSLDGARHWSPFETGLANTDVRDVTIDAAGTQLEVGTLGNGVFGFTT